MVLATPGLSGTLLEGSGFRDLGFRVALGHCVEFVLVRTCAGLAKRFKARNASLQHLDLNLAACIYGLDRQHVVPHARPKLQC